MHASVDPNFRLDEDNVLTTQHRRRLVKPDSDHRSKCSAFQSPRCEIDLRDAQSLFIRPPVDHVLKQIDQQLQPHSTLDQTFSSSRQTPVQTTLYLGRLCHNRHRLALSMSQCSKLQSGMGIHGAASKWARPTATPRRDGAPDRWTVSLQANSR